MKFWIDNKATYINKQKKEVAIKRNRNKKEFDCTGINKKQNNNSDIKEESNECMQNVELQRSDEDKIAAMFLDDLNTKDQNGKDISDEATQMLPLLEEFEQNSYYLNDGMVLQKIPINNLQDQDNLYFFSRINNYHTEEEVTDHFNKITGNSQIKDKYDKHYEDDTNMSKEMAVLQNQLNVIPIKNHDEEMEDKAIEEILCHAKIK